MIRPNNEMSIESCNVAHSYLIILHWKHASGFLFTCAAGGIRLEPEVVETGVMVWDGSFTAALFPGVLQREKALREPRGCSGEESASIGEMDRERSGVALDLKLVVSFSPATEKNKIEFTQQLDKMLFLYQAVHSINCSVIQSQ